MAQAALPARAADDRANAPRIKPTHRQRRRQIVPELGGPGIRVGSCDDGLIAANPAGNAAAFDGRIDNCDELRRALGRDDLKRRDNAEIALLCYDKWGDDFCDHIIGDYACILWDGRRQRLVMAVDPGALRPLYYWLGANEILFASEQRGLLADPRVARALDEDQIASWLCLLPRDLQRTFFRGIFRVPPGHRVIWENGAARCERWWHPEHLPILRLRTDRDYEDAVRTALREAVQCRLGHHEKIGAHLSGGLDSTSVAATAARLLADQGRRLAAFTAVPAHPAVDEPHRFGDEWQHAAAVAAMYPNIDHVRVANNDQPLFAAMALRESALDSPVINPANTIWINGIEREARVRGITVMLKSQMGNRLQLQRRRAPRGATSQLQFFRGADDQGFAPRRRAFLAGAARRCRRCGFSRCRATSASSRRRQSGAGSFRFNVVARTLSAPRA